MKKHEVVMTALLSAFVTAALLFAFRMDYGWYRFWQLDGDCPPARSLNEYASLFPGTVNFFGRTFKMTVPSGEKVKIYTDDPC